MTKDQIIKLAIEAGIRHCTCNGELGCLERFASLVAEREWVGLTDEEQEEIYKKHIMDGWGLFYDAIEAKLKEKNT